MLKKSLAIIGVAAAFFAQAQDVSVLRNTVDVYSNTNHFGGAKYNAMVGATGALGGEFSSLLNNPAGIGLAITDDFSATLGIQGNKNQSTLAGKSLSDKSTNTNLVNAGGLATFQLMTETPWKFVNVAINYSNRSLDNYVETPGNTNITFQKNLLDASDNPVVGNLAYQGHAYDRVGDASVMNVGVGANYDNNLYFGVGLNFHNVSLDQYDSAAFSLDLDANRTSVYDKQYTPYTEKSSGFSATLGVIGKVNNMLRLGASIQTPTWWQIDRAYRTYSENPNGSMGYTDYGENRKFRSPLKATLSAAYVPNKAFAINLDYTLGLTKPHYKVMGDAETELNNFQEDFYSNQHEVKVGAEYRVKQWRLRGGYAYASAPFDNINATAYNTAGVATDTNFSNLILGDRNTVGLGVGYDFKSFFIDASYQNVSSTYKNPFLQGSVMSNSPYFSTGYHGDFDVVSDAYAVSEVKNNRNNFFITVGWKF